LEEPFTPLTADADHAWPLHDAQRRVDSPEVAGFEKAYADWRDRRFPPGSANDAVDELHADLALADTWVAEAAVPVMDGREHTPVRVDVSGELRALRKRATALLEHVGTADQALVTSYVDYIDALAAVYESLPPENSD
jgi:hypothetical protein